MAQYIGIKKCVECGCEFTAKAHNAKCCPACRRAHRRKLEAQKRTIERLRLMNAKPLSSIQWDIKQYNEKHGTNLSYGQYVAFVEGVLKV